MDKIQLKTNSNACDKTVKIHGKKKIQMNTYDFSPFPYIPIRCESCDFFDDRPNVIISAASSEIIIYFV